MSKYTTQLRYICESEAGITESKGYNSVDEIIEAAIPKIFNFNYPIDENRKEGLEKKILRYYYLREIGAETYGVWKLLLENKMQTIMPYYNKLYESAELQFDPLENTDYTVTRNGNYGSEGSESATYSETRSGNNNRTDKNDNNSEGWNLYSDTPQGAIGNLNDETYLTNATKLVNENHASGTSGINYEDSIRSTNDISRLGKNDEKITTVYKGKQNGENYSVLLKQYRDTILNIDKMVIDELADLFMNLW